ncbi:MAG TPA: thioredoxin domain-containing protein [Gaiellaceae bacterium]|jgi:protein-disulfide isomerase
MPSGKQSRRQRRTVKVPPTPASGRRDRRASPRVLAIAAVVIGLAVAAVVVGIVATRGSDSTQAENVPRRGSLVNALPGAAEVQSMYAGIPQARNLIGSASAPVTMVEYVDLQCPYCRTFELSVMPTLVSRYVKTGKLRIDTRPIAFIGPDSVSGREALVAAGHQQRFYNFMQLLYLNQGAENSGWLDDELITAVAASIPGMNVPRLLRERDSDVVAAETTRFDEEAQAQGVNSTPTIFVGRTGTTPEHVPLSSPDDAAAIVKAIQNALA